VLTTLINHPASLEPSAFRFIQCSHFKNHSMMLSQETDFGWKWPWW
jgi:hypothetical protein